MEAKNTVMTWKQTVECSHNPVLELRERDICLAQAEITWPIARKVGYDKALTQLAEMTEECKQMGRKEVVEWIESHKDTGWGGTILVHFLASITEWQAKLKEWGI